MFYEQFRCCCNEKNVSRTKACTDCGISRTAWHKWEAGAVPNGSTLNKLADYFGVSVSFLLGEEEQKENLTAQLGSEALKQAGYDLLNEENRAFIDQMIAKLVASQSDK